MKLGGLILFLLLAFSLRAQTNLVPNPSFEDFIKCPVIVAERLSPDTFRTVKHWYSPSFASPDYFHTCSPPPTNPWFNQSLGVPLNTRGTQLPRTGQAYMGMLTFVANKNGPIDSREYIAVKLTQPLVKDFTYRVQFFVSSAELTSFQKGTMDISSIGMHFSASPLRNFPDGSVIVLDAQVANPPSNILTDQANWQPVNGTYKAKGGERWIILGNLLAPNATQYQPRYTDFDEATLHSYYYIDDVSIQLAQTSNSITDTAICAQAGILFPQVPHSANCVWNDGQTAPQRTFTTSGKWWVTYSSIDGLYTATDTLNLVVWPTGTKKDTVMCAGSVMLLKARAATSYAWNTGSTTPALAVFTSGTYWVKRTLNGCSMIDTFVIRELDCSLLPPGGLHDTIICSGGSVLFPRQLYNDSAAWNDGSTVKQRTFTTSGKWWITYYISGYGLTADTLNLAVLPPTGTTKDTVICKGQQMMLDAGSASSYRWSTGANTSSITTINTGLYWVERRVDSCLVIDTFRVRRLPFPSVPALNDTAFCAGDSVLAGHSPVNGYAFTWYPSLLNTPAIFISDPGKYILRIDSAACFAYDTLSVVKHENPVIGLDPDTVVCFGDLEQIQLDAGVFNTYLWQPTGETTRSVYATQAMLYLLTVTDTNRCYSTQQVLVDEECTSRLFFPNVFTPNNDGMNDVYEVRGTKQYTQAFSMQIYNRWGVCVFSTTSVYETWDGTMNRNPQPDDAYALVASYRLGGKRHEVKMWVTLIR